MELSEIKDGDFLFYTERPYGSNYADGLVRVNNIGGVLFAHTVCVNRFRKYIDFNDDNPIPIGWYFDKNCWIKTSYTPEFGTASVWMSENYPLTND